MPMVKAKESSHDVVGDEGFKPPTPCAMQVL